MRNILEIIKKMPEGRELFSILIGVGTFRLSTNKTTDYPIILNDANGHTTYDEFGRLYKEYEESECVIFPSKDCRDWKDWAQKLVKDGDIVRMAGGKVVRFDPSKMTYSGVVRFASEDELTEDEQDEQPTEKAIFVPKAIFEPFDKVLVADRAGEHWQCNLFSNYIAGTEMQGKFRCLTNPWKLCIPFEGNENLVGTIVTREQVAEINKVYK